MCARKLDYVENDCLLTEPRRSKLNPEAAKKHSLDSDEEDYNTDDENLLDENDIEGREEGVARQVGNQRITPFNMQDELEEGHFDKDGHFIWNKESEIRDNWLDNIDWQTVKLTGTKYYLDSSKKGLADDSDSETEAKQNFDEIEIYKQILSYIKPSESINRAIRRLGGTKENVSSVERLKRKKTGTLNISEDVTKLTELGNKILTETGNMDIYQETYESIIKKIEVITKKGKAVASEPELDMYADDFSEKEKNRKGKAGEVFHAMDEKQDVFKRKEVQWEFMWNKDNQRIEGPYSTAQMLKWANEGYFKAGIYVRMLGEDIFYPSRRINFELYL